MTPPPEELEPGSTAHMLEFARRNLSLVSMMDNADDDARFSNRGASMDRLVLADVSAQVVIARSLDRIANALEGKS